MVQPDPTQLDYIQIAPYTTELEEGEKFKNGAKAGQIDACYLRIKAGKHASDKSEVVCRHTLRRIPRCLQLVQTPGPYQVWGVPKDTRINPVWTDTEVTVLTNAPEGVELIALLY